MRGLLQLCTLPIAALMPCKPSAKHTLLEQVAPVSSSSCRLQIAPRFRVTICAVGQIKVNFEDSMEMLWLVTFLAA